MTVRESMAPLSLLSTDRAQSETVGVVLLTGVIVIVVAVIGGVVLSGVGADAGAPVVDIGGEATSQDVLVIHNGGDSLARSDVDIIMEGDQRIRHSLDTYTQQVGADNTRFERGDIWERSNEVTGERLTLIAIHVPSNTILDREPIDVRVTSFVRFSYSPSNPTSTSDVDFDASDSEFTDGSIASYDWEFNNGAQTANGVTASYSFPDDGAYPVTLTITADDGRTASRTKTVTVYNDNPGASFTYSPTDPGPGDEITFDASGSTDSDGTIDSYEWDWTNDGSYDATGETAKHTYSTEGEKTATLRVTDDDGATSRESQTVTVGSSGPRQDPGFAYEDVNNDRVYSSADGDFEVDVSDGTYDAASNGSSLVIPNSVSPIAASSVSLKGRTVIVETDVASSGAATLSATAGTLDVSGQRIESNGGGQELSLSGPTVDATGATIESAGKLTSAVSSSADFSRATVRSRGSGQELAFSGGGTLTATDATITSAGKITVSGAPAIDLSRSTIRSQGSGQELKLSGGGTLTATDATITSAGSVTTTVSGALDIGGATVESRGSGQEAKFEAASVTGVGATIDSAGSITAKATGSTVRFTGATLDVVDGSSQEIALTSNGEMYLDNARLVGDEFSTFSGSRQNNGNTLYVGGAVFEDGSGAPKEFDVSPGSRRGGGSKSPQGVNGTPQKGTVV